MPKFIIYDYFQEENDGIVAEFYDFDEAIDKLNELGNDGYYMETIE